jgi:hypothetical protein
MLPSPSCCEDTPNIRLSHHKGDLHELFNSCEDTPNIRLSHLPAFSTAIPLGCEDTPNIRLSHPYLLQSIDNQVLRADSAKQKMKPGGANAM